jgi:hypothetical protein
VVIKDGIAVEVSGKFVVPLAVETLPVFVLAGKVEDSVFGLFRRVVVVGELDLRSMVTASAGGSPPLGELDVVSDAVFAASSGSSAGGCWQPVCSDDDKSVVAVVPLLRSSTQTSKCLIVHFVR